MSYLPQFTKKSSGYSSSSQGGYPQSGYPTYSHPHSNYNYNYNSNYNYNNNYSNNCSYSHNYSQQAPANALHFPLYLVIYNNDKLKLTPTQMQQIFTKQAYKYTQIKMHLRKWNYRVQFEFQNKFARNQAIQHIKKIKDRFDVKFYFYFERRDYTYRLMEEWEYRNAINHAAMPPPTTTTNDTIINQNQQSNTNQIGYTQVEKQLPNKTKNVNKNIELQLQGSIKQRERENSNMEQQKQVILKSTRSQKQVIIQQQKQQKTNGIQQQNKTNQLMKQSQQNKNQKPAQQQQQQQQYKSQQKQKQQLRDNQYKEQKQQILPQKQKKAKLSRQSNEVYAVKPIEENQNQLYASYFNLVNINSIKQSVAVHQHRTQKNYSDQQGAVAKIGYMHDNNNSRMQEQSNLAGQTNMAKSSSMIKQFNKKQSIQQTNNNKNQAQQMVDQQPITITIPSNNNNNKQIQNQSNISINLNSMEMENVNKPIIVKKSLRQKTLDDLYPKYGKQVMDLLANKSLIRELLLYELQIVNSN